MAADPHQPAQRHQLRRRALAGDPQAQRHPGPEGGHPGSRASSSSRCSCSSCSRACASPAMASGLLDNEGTQLGNEMLDTQWSSKLSGQPGGLSDIIARQLERQMGMNARPDPEARTAPTTRRSNLGPAEPPRCRCRSRLPPPSCSSTPKPPRPPKPATGVPASFMISQAALETGWGRKEIRHGRRQQSANNLFGIKAGKELERRRPPTCMTTEYVNGQAAQDGAEVPRLQPATPSPLPTTPS